MKKWKLVLWHIGVWCIAPVTVIPAMYRFNASSAIPYWMTAYLIYISSFYVSLYFVLPGWVKRRKTLLLLLNWFILIIIYTAILLFVNNLFGVYQRGSVQFKVLKFFFISCTYMCILFLLSIAYRFAIDWFQNERIKQQLENQNLKSELSFLKSQINPHFLFNTLNNIYILAYQQSVKTADAVMKLSEMMRYMLYESNDEQVPLTKEIAYIRQMINLQQLRLKEPMSLYLSINGEITDQNIPPLLFIPFVENIFKHAQLNDQNDPVVMQLKAEHKLLHFHCRNPINHAVKDTTGGIGLSNVKRRLELLYPGKHFFRTEKNETHYTVDLTIQLS